jgi:uncharacterized sporulation protein YeaH/YhbH (DUF444 family)
VETRCKRRRITLKNSGDMVQKEKKEKTMSPLFFNVNSGVSTVHVAEQWRHGAGEGGGGEGEGEEEGEGKGEDHVSTVLQREQWSLHCSRCRIVDMVQKQEKEKGKEKS